MTAIGSYFEKAAADRAVGFVQQLRHTKGRWAGQRFILPKWQRKIIADLFGTMNADGLRQYRTAYIEIPRKNGKSTLAAAIALLLLFLDDEPGAEIYGAATDREQASIVFDVAASMVLRCAPLRQRCQVIPSKKRIIIPSSESFYAVLPADAFGRGSHGFNPHGVLFDELHTQTRRDFFDALTTGSGTRSQPLILELTTAGYDRASICWEEHEYARQVLEGTIEDPEYYPVIYAAPDGAKWNSKRVWRACNPALGDFLSMGYLEREARKAKHSPARQNTFRRLFTNQWTQQVNRWLDLDLWDQNGRQVREEKLRGRVCYGGLDLGWVDDLTAWLLVFPGEKDPEELEVLARFWCPEARLTAESNRYRDQYQTWKRKDILKTTPGRASDYNAVREQILDDAERYEIREIGVDRWQAHKLTSELEDEGLDVVGVGQGHKGMGEPMKEMMRLLLAKKLLHGGNPLLRWMADNVAVREDPSGNVKPDKAASDGKIDGIVALAMAISRAMLHEDQDSIYETEGVKMA